MKRMNRWLGIIMSVMLTTGLLQAPIYAVETGSTAVESEVEGENTEIAEVTEDIEIDSEDDLVEEAPSKEELVADEVPQEDSVESSFEDTEVVENVQEQPEVTDQESSDEGQSSDTEQSFDSSEEQYTPATEEVVLDETDVENMRENELALEQIRLFQDKVKLWKCDNQITIVYDSTEDVRLMYSIYSDTTEELLYTGELKWNEESSLYYEAVDFDAVNEARQADDEDAKIIDIKNSTVRIVLESEYSQYEEVIAHDIETIAIGNVDTETEGHISVGWNVSKTAYGYSVIICRADEESAVTVYDTVENQIDLDISKNKVKSITVAPYRYDDSVIKFYGEASSFDITQEPDDNYLEENDDDSQTIISEAETDSVVSNKVFASVSTPADGNRYTVLLLDNSGSMANDSRITIAKEAAIRFCEQMLAADGINYISVVGYESSVKYAYDFTNQIDVLKSEINKMSASGGTNINAALKQAETLLNNVPANSNKNIVLLSDGIPESGDMSESGHYSKTDHNSSYQYGNVIYSTAKSMDNSWNIYTMGFFQGLTGSDFSFGKKLLYDIQNHGYYDVQDADELEVVFDEISAGILDDLTIVGPLSAEDGDDITITATFKSEGSVPGKSNIKWKCEPEYLYFDNIRMEGPEITGEENLWRISVDADVAFPDVSGKKTGSRTAAVSVSVGQYTVRKNFTVKAQTVFKAEKNGFPVVNDNDGFGYPSDYHFPYQRYVQAIGGNLFSAGISLDFGVTNHFYNDKFKGAVWGGNCGALSILAAAEFEGKIDLKHTYFSNNRGGVLSKYGYQNKTSKRYTFSKDSEFVKLVEKVQIASQGCAEIWNCKVFKDDSDYSKLIAELKKGNGKPYVVYLKGHHAVVIDPSKPVIDCGNGETMVHIYDPNTPYAGYKLDNPFNRYISEPISDQREDVPMLVLNSSGNVKISYPAHSYAWYEYEGTTRDQVDIYDISKLNPSFFSSATYVGFTRGNIVTDSLDMTWDTDNNLRLNGKRVFSSNDKANCGAFVHTSLNTKDSQDGDMYYFDADATLIDYESPKALVTFVNDIYPAQYSLMNEGQASMNVDLQNHIVSALAEEDGTKIIITSMVDEGGEDGYVLEMVLKKDQKITVSQNGKELIFTKENVNSGNQDADDPVIINSTYISKYRTNTSETTVTDTINMELDRRSVTYSVIDGVCGNDAYWKITEDGILTIYGEGSTDDFVTTYISSTMKYKAEYPWADYSDSIETVVIGEGITRIGDYAFTGTSVKHVVFEGDLRIIGEGAFWYCENLEEMEIPESVIQIDARAFEKCSAMTSIKLPEGLTTISFQLLKGCKMLTSIDIPNGVTEIGNAAFEGCPFETIDIPFGVTTIGWSAFSGIKIKQLVIPPTVTSIGTSAFLGCINLESISLPDSITEIKDLTFDSCRKLNSVVIPSSVTSIGDYAFGECQFDTVYLPVSLRKMGESVNYSGKTSSEINGDILTELYYEGSASQWKAISKGSIYGGDGMMTTWNIHYNTPLPSIDKTVVSGLTGKTYTGKPTEQDLVVRFSDTTLVEGKDYQLWYQDNIYPGTATIYINGIGNYAGTRQINYAIRKGNISGATITDVSDQVYSGTDITQKPIVTLADAELQEGIDYELSFSDNKDVGMASIVITGIGNYQGTKTVYFEIKAASLDDASILGVSGKHYTGDRIKISPIVYYANNRLKQGTDYEVEYSNNLNVGKASLTINGIGNFVGKKTASFQIDAMPISDIEINGISSETYTGEEITQKPVLKDGSHTLLEGTDYAVEYENNINAGTATINFIGKGNYGGTNSRTFTITPKEITPAIILSPTSFIYNGKEQKPKVVVKDGETELSISDYNVTWSSGCTNVGTYQANIALKDNYSGSGTASYMIMANEVTPEITLSKESFVYNGGEQKPIVTVKAGNKELTASDYDVIWPSGCIDAGIYEIKVILKGSYSGTVTKSFTILPGKTTRGDMFNLANNVKVTWKEVPGAKYYKVYREGVTDKKESQKVPVIVTERLVGWDSQPGLTNGHAYRYKIVASLTGKSDSSGDSPLSYSKLMYRLKTVVIRSVKNNAPGKVTVKYDKTTSGDSYVLQYCERQDMVGAKTKVVLGANNTSYTIGGLKKGKTYYISIRVRKKVNGIDYYTTFGVPKKVTIEK